VAALPNDALSENQVRPWVLPPVYERMRSGRAFSDELRPAVSLFLRFGALITMRMNQPEPNWMPTFAGCNKC